MGKYPPESLEKKIAAKDPKVWATEAFEYAVNKRYSFTKNSNQITQAYQDEMRELCHQQIALAGYRLAETIAGIYES